MTGRWALHHGRILAFGGKLGDRAILEAQTDCQQSLVVMVLMKPAAVMMVVKIQKMLSEMKLDEIVVVVVVLLNLEVLLLEVLECLFEIFLFSM